MAADKGKLWSIDIQVAATLYIKAETAEQAMEIAKRVGAQPIEVRDDTRNEAGEADFCGLAFSDPDLPDVSLSPCMMGHGPWPGEQPELVDE